MTAALPPMTNAGIRPATLAQIVRRRAAERGDEAAYVFLPGANAEPQSLTWDMLDRRAAELGAVLRERGAAGERVLLALPSGLGFVEAVFACWYAGATIVPISLPRHHRVKHRLHQIVADAGARFAVGAADAKQRLEGESAEGPAIAGLTWIDVAATAPTAATPADPFHQADAGDIALLQYTSGSTGVPRGVVVTHANLMCNSALIADACGHAPGQTIAGWLPLFHDMGLIGLVLQAAFAGTRCVLMPAEQFLMRPWLWLQMMSDYQVRSCPAPNFAYDLCVDKVTAAHKVSLDLSHWQYALNGSEPVRAATLDRFSAAFASCGFRPETFFPCYGLAEATLFVTGPGERHVRPRRQTDGSSALPNDPQAHVGCGRPFGDTRLAIVDPETCRQLPPGGIGEIWIAGESCAGGYWNNPAGTAETFGAQLAEPAAPSDADTRWLRTGDLGFVSEGELFITGRLRELVIIAGRNHFPVDIERTVEAADPAIAVSAAAAFGTDIDGAERLVIVAEVRRELARAARGSTSGDAVAIDPAGIARRVRAAVAAEHDVAPHEVVLLCPGALPRTTSGKISRRTARDHYRSRSLERWESPSNVVANVR